MSKVIMIGVLTKVCQNKQIVIQKFGKDNSIVKVDKRQYIKKMENFLSYQSKFE